MLNRIYHPYSKTDGYFRNTREEMLQYVPQNSKKTLEFGCGCGAFSELVNKTLNAECWGVEIDDMSARIASKNLHRVINKDAIESLTIIPDNYFDCIILNDVLEHLYDPFNLIVKLKTKLATSGVVVISIPNVRFWNNLRNLVWYGEWEYKEAGILDFTHLRFFTYKSLLKMFKRSGYEILRIDGLRPTHSTKFRVLNFLLFNRLSDAKFHQYVCVIKPIP